MSVETFHQLNQLRSQNNEPTFANPRNAASGSLRTIRPNDYKKQKFRCLFIYFNFSTKPSNETQWVLYNS